MPEWSPCAILSGPRRLAEISALKSTENVGMVLTRGRHLAWSDRSLPGDPDVAVLEAAQMDFRMHCMALASFTHPPRQNSLRMTRIAYFIRVIRVIRGESSLPLCQVRNTIGKVPADLKAIVENGLRLAAEYFATLTRSLK
jgi:hypothetical protein